MDSIVINNLQGGYENKTVLHDISIAIEHNKLNAIIGPNGSGKSTLAKYLIKELKTKYNKISVLNDDINSLSQKELANKISFVPQNTKQDYDFSVFELVAMGRYCHDDIENNLLKVQESIDLVGISTIQNRLITQISGGELQLAMLARAICQDTDIIILDEPTNNLDPKHSLKLINILTKLKKQNITIVCIIHDLNTVLRYFDNAILINKGKIFAKGNVTDVITEKNIDIVYGIESKIIPAHDQLPTTIYYIQ